MTESHFVLENLYPASPEKYAKSRTILTLILLERSENVRDGTSLSSEFTATTVRLVITIRVNATVFATSRTYQRLFKFQYDASANRAHRAYEISLTEIRWPTGAAGKTGRIRLARRHHTKRLRVIFFLSTPFHVRHIRILYVYYCYYRRRRHPLTVTGGRGGEKYIKQINKYLDARSW